MGLSCTDLLIGGSFSVSRTTVLQGSWLVEFMGAELEILRDDYKVLKFNLSKL